VQEYKYLGIHMREVVGDSRASGALEAQYAKKQAKKGMAKLGALGPLLSDTSYPIGIEENDVHLAPRNSTALLQLPGNHR
jgi:hypothetical protein